MELPHLEQLELMTLDLQQMNRDFEDFAKEIGINNRKDSAA